MEELGACPFDEYDALSSFVPLSQNIQNECIVPIRELPRQYRNEIDKGCSTGWRCVDYYLQGLRPGEVTVITADTGAGKTTFCTQLVINCAMQDVPVWINSWEMRPETIMRKLASIVLRRPMKIQNFSDFENEQFDEWCSRYQVYINPVTIGTDINKLAAQLNIAKELGVRIVMLDHLDYLVNFRKEKLHEAIDETVKKLVSLHSRSRCISSYLPSSTVFYVRGRGWHPFAQRLIIHQECR